MAEPAATNRTFARAAGCFFDFDGLLLDTAALWAHAYLEACIASGGESDRIDVAALQGASVPSAAEVLSRQIGADVDPATLVHVLTDAFRSQPPPVLPGVESLLEKLPASTPLTVVTNGPGWLAAESLAVAGLDHRFGRIVSAERTPRPKPAPDPYLIACRETGVSTSEAVAFEDSAVGVRAARSAGLLVVGVPSSPAALDADVVVTSLDDARLLSAVGLA